MKIRDETPNSTMTTGAINTRAAVKHLASPFRVAWFLVPRHSGPCRKGKILSVLEVLPAGLGCEESHITGHFRHSLQQHQPGGRLRRRYRDRAETVATGPFVLNCRT